MAAVSIPPSPHRIGITTNRRVPLSNIPHAANSPFRAVAAAASKRARSLADETSDGQPPPTKKQAVEEKDSNPRTPPPRRHLEGRILSRRVLEPQPTAFSRKLLAAKDRASGNHNLGNGTTVDEPLESLRQWQKHYRKVFPSFVFYFESVPDDARRQCLRQLAAFSAREEKFFSKNVTHVITTRPIPTDVQRSTSANSARLPTISNPQEGAQPRTINPLLLEKFTDASNNPARNSFRSKFASEVQNGKNPSHPQDILQRAKDMGIKIWQLEKINRILHGMSEDPNVDVSSQQIHNTRSRSTYVTASARPANLSQLLKNEQLKNYANRDSTLAPNELHPFKGPYIYIYDMNEKTKPVMVREYPKVDRREDGEWPQFRSVSHGKCPFLREVDNNKPGVDKESIRKEERAMTAIAHVNIPYTRAAAAIESANMQGPSSHMARQSSMYGTEQGTICSTGLKENLSLSMTRDPFVNQVEVAEKPYKHKINSFGTGFPGGEPMASGIQASNITSAIRSQMISSTASVPGAKAGTSKEIHGLKRKVLERNSVPTLNGIGALRYSADMGTVARLGVGAIPARHNASEKTGHNKLRNIEEDTTASDQEAAERQDLLRRSKASKLLNSKQKESRPGYCENCREKFDDFDLHILGRKHRKFATTHDNWKDLDTLLQELVRPIRNEKAADDEE